MSPLCVRKLGYHPPSMQYFVSDVTDVVFNCRTVGPVPPPTWLDANGALLESAVLRSPDLVANLAFHAAWRAALGVPPTRVDARDFAQRMSRLSSVKDALVECLVECSPIRILPDVQARVMRAVQAYATAHSDMTRHPEVVKHALLRKLLDRHSSAHDADQDDARIRALACIPHHVGGIVAAYIKVVCGDECSLPMFEQWWTAASHHDAMSQGHPCPSAPTTPAEAYARAVTVTQRLQLPARDPISGSHWMAPPPGDDYDAASGSVLSCTEALRLSIMRDSYLWRTDTGRTCLAGVGAQALLHRVLGPHMTLRRKHRVAPVPHDLLAIALRQAPLYCTIAHANALPSHDNSHSTHLTHLVHMVPTITPTPSRMRGGTVLQLGGLPPDTVKYPLSSPFNISNADPVWWVPATAMAAPPTDAAQAVGSETAVQPAAHWSAALTQAMLSAHFDNTHPGQLLLFEFMARYIETRQLASRVLRCAEASPPRSPLAGEHSAVLGDVVLVDTRSNVWSVLAMLITLDNLDAARWRAVVFCAPRNAPFMRACLVPRMPGVRIETMDDINPDRGAHRGDDPSGPFDMDTYNRVLMSPTFWRRLQGPLALVIQDDGMLVRPGLENEAELLAADYVGAPWARVADNRELELRVGKELVGNGGLSLRRVEAALRACLADHHTDMKVLFNHRLQQVPEDVFFACAAASAGRACPRHLAHRLSVEQVEPPTGARAPLGLHKPWPYLHIERWAAILQDALLEQCSRGLDCA